MADSIKAARGVPDGAITSAAQVDILIVNWNSGDQLAACVASIAAHGDGLVGRVVVIDNGSVDGSADIAPADMPIDIVRAGRNLGFGAACNLAARRSDSELILLLNPDAELRSGVLARVVSYISAPEHAGVGVVGIRLEGRDGVPHRHCARFPSWRSFVGNSIGLTRIIPKSFPPILLADFDHLSSRDVDHVMGAFYLIRRETFEALGGFDEDFFVYLEDLDLSLRVAAHGQKTHYLADVSAYHKQGGTSEQVKAHRLFYALQSNILYAFKHLSSAQAWGVAAATLLIEPPSRIVRALTRVSIKELAYTLQGFGMLYAALPKIATSIYGRGRKMPATDDQWPRT